MKPSEVYLYGRRMTHKEFEEFKNTEAGYLYMHPDEDEDDWVSQGGNPLVSLKRNLDPVFKKKKTISKFIKLEKKKNPFWKI